MTDIQELTRKRESKNEYLGDTVCPPVRGYSSKGRCWYVKKYCKYYIIMNSVRMFAATYIDHYIHVFCLRLAGPPVPPGPPGMQHKRANVQHASWQQKSTRAQQGTCNASDALLIVVCNPYRNCSCSSLQSYS